MQTEYLGRLGFGYISEHDGKWYRVPFEADEEPRDFKKSDGCTKGYAEERGREPEVTLV